MIKQEDFNQNINSLIGAVHAKQTIALAISGGADSMCLALLMSKWVKKNKLKLICLIVDHKLRDESTKEASYVKDVLNKKGLIAEVLTWEHKEKPKSNIHNKAREARYNLLLDYCTANRIKVLLTAHNKDDQAETIMMRIFRGSGLDGACGIPEVTQVKKVNILRPLLKFLRIDIEATLRENKWDWVEDPSNQNDKFARVKIRKLLKSYEDYELIVNRINLFAHNMQRTREFISKALHKAYKKVCKESKLGYIEIDAKEFKKLEEELALKVLLKVLQNVGGKVIATRLDSLNLLYKHILDAGNKASTLHGCEISITENKINVLRELCDVEQNKKIIPQKFVEWDRRYVIKTKEKDLVIGPLCKEGLKQLKSWIKGKNIELASAKILYTTPAVFDQKGKLVAYPLLSLQDKELRKNVELKKLATHYNEELSF